MIDMVSRSMEKVAEEEKEGAKTWYERHMWKEPVN